VNVTSSSLRTMTNVTRVIPAVLSAMVQIVINVINVLTTTSNRSTMIYVLTGVQQVRPRTVT